MPAPSFRTAIVLSCLCAATDGIAVELTICADYGCKTQHAVQIPDADWLRVRSLFAQAGANAEDERRSIQHAIALLENTVGPLTGTANDRGGNVAGSGEPGQMDCIDESTNTTTYLELLHDDGLLRWHNLGPRASRARWIIDVHWSATVTEAQSGQHYVVDSWFRDNGELPVIQRLEDWQAKRPFE